ncbi:HlyD family secretion protein [Marivita sp. S0852]|uniref:HlyD family secretion protein n=1 Tax=Marivita sp. S0852 TaxID=3373893 RepID=UPI0039824953
MTKKRKLFGWIGAAVIAVAGGVGYFYWQAQQNDGPLNFAEGNGRIEANLVDVATEITGRVLQVQVQEGDLVETGDILARIKTDTLEAQLARAEADVASAESQATQAEAMIDQRQADLTFAEKELTRAQQLFDRGFGTEEEVDRRRSERDVASAGLAAAQASLAAAERQADAARAQSREITTQIEDAEIEAPVTGRVLYRLAEPGEVLASGARIVTLVDLSRIYMEIYLPTAQAARVAIGAEARIALDGIDLVVPAQVTFVSPEAQFTPEHVETQDVRADLMFRVRLRVPQDLIERNIDYVKTGMRGVGHIRLAGSEDVAWPDNLTLSDAAPLARGN